MGKPGSMLSRTLCTLRNRSARNASTLVLADHANSALNPSTLHTISAARAIGGDISVLVAGKGSADVAAEISQVEGVSRVFVADVAAVENQLAENVCQLMEGIQQKESFTHVIGSTSAVAKGALPRLAAMLDVAAISDVTEVEAEDTFVRLAVDAGYAPNDMQVGQTGKVVAPDLYFAVGISGAIQHLAGMKDSKVIVAINKDPEAPIFEVADYGLVGDLFTELPKLESALQQ